MSASATASFPDLFHTGPGSPKREASVIIEGGSFTCQMPCLTASEQGGCCLPFVLGGETLAVFVCGMNCCWHCCVRSLSVPRPTSAKCFTTRVSGRIFLTLRQEDR